MKAGESHMVYLSKQAVDVIANQRGLDPAIVFPLDGRSRNSEDEIDVHRCPRSRRTSEVGICFS
jgi:hypothetical protein